MKSGLLVLVSMVQISTLIYINSIQSAYDVLNFRYDAYMFQFGLCLIDVPDIGFI